MNDIIVIDRKTCINSASFSNDHKYLCVGASDSKAII